MLFGIVLVCVLPCFCVGEAVQPTADRPGCIHNDGTFHPPGSTFYPNPCEHCVCPDEGGHSYCAILDCLQPPCVDATKGKEDCCYKCPNGPNCHLNGKIIPAGQDFEEGEMTCRCPDHDPILGNEPVDIQAECSLRPPEPTGPSGPRG